MTTFRRLFTARREAVLGAIEEALDFLSGCGLAPATRYAVDLALEELLSNVAKYAYPASEVGEMAVVIEQRPDSIRLEVEDAGRPFDPTAVEPPPLMTLDTPTGGRGIHLVRSLAKSMHYRRDGARNILVVEFGTP